MVETKTRMVMNEVLKVKLAAGTGTTTIEGIWVVEEEKVADRIDTVEEVSIEMKEVVTVEVEEGEASEEASEEEDVEDLGMTVVVDVEEEGGGEEEEVVVSRKRRPTLVQVSTMRTGSKSNNIC